MLDGLRLSTICHVWVNYSNQNGSVLLPCIFTVYYHAYSFFFVPFFLQKIDNIFVETLL